MKTCNTCDVDRPLTDYRKCGKHKNGTQKYRPTCKVCEKDVIVNIIKEIHGDCCTNCGYDKLFSALDLHHLDPDQKEYQVSAMKGYPISRVRDEIKKCVLLCSNCHRELHAGLCMEGWQSGNAAPC